VCQGLLLVVVVEALDLVVQPLELVVLVAVVEVLFQTAHQHKRVLLTQALVVAVSQTATEIQITRVVQV
jgi:hypothetical protein